ncbi:Cof-type HAD-IIB family hydrolase [Acidisphaera sp. L21]|uniref:Cof-type HAD-IIB family hydrolase n=1 Tax=Acidisphaera sp. L21 TaxID=1641851 RepID=UPI001C2062D8|nr:Cof-type HAD-IIB family hydrolase [Acidisphaera sp. L21]
MPIKLVVSDVDGTMVNSEKLLTPATIDAAHRLRHAGVHLALVSSRPPRGMAFLTMDLGLTGPLGGFNGATILAPDGAVIEENVVPEAAVRASLDLLARRGVDAWLFADNQWFIKNLDGAYVPKERRTVRFDPVVVDDFEPYVARCGKVVGASKDFDGLAECEAELQGVLGHSAHAHRSQRYYLDVTNPHTDKGTAARSFASWYGIDISEVCAIGDQFNDVPMFRVAGYSVAMGNAPPAVSAHAKHHSSTNEEDGWAAAIDRYVLPNAG